MVFATSATTSKHKMKNRTDKQFEINLPDSIVALNLCQARDSASACAKLYLEEAKQVDDTVRSESLEALAIERAIVADQIEEIARDRFGVEVGEIEKRGQRKEDLSTLAQCEQTLKHVCEKLYRRCNDNKLKHYLRDLRSNLLGLASSYEPCRTSAASASISM